MIDDWLEGVVIHQPSDLFREFPDFDPDIQCMILKPRELLLETLEFFGLPKGYMNKVGHWKNWVENKLQE
jgi:hypothetical protein